jgi:potassium efflux system protein
VRFGKVVIRLAAGRGSVSSQEASQPVAAARAGDIMLGTRALVARHIMTKILGRTLKLLVGLCCFGSMLPTWGQQAGIQLTPELLQNQIAAVQESVQLDDGAKARLIDLYRQSINNLENARANRAAAESFRQARRTAPAETDKRLARIEARRGSDPVADLDISARIPLELLVRRLDEEFANEAAVEAKVAVLDARIEVEAARPSKARQRIAAARAEVEELAGQSGFQPPDNQAPQMADAARWASQTRLEALQTEIAMLDEELLSYSLRNDLLKAEREEAAQSLGRIRQRVNVLRDAIIERRRLEAESAMQQAQA